MGGRPVAKLTSTSSSVSSHLYGLRTS
jgi:hypothetical protein